MGEQGPKSVWSTEEFAARLNPGTPRSRGSDHVDRDDVMGFGTSEESHGPEEASIRTTENDAEGAAQISAISTSEAWFVPDPDDVPPEDSTPISYMPPPSRPVPSIPSSLPALQIPGVRGVVISPPTMPTALPPPSPLSTSPSSSAWGSHIADLDSASHTSTVSTLSTSPSPPPASSSSFLSPTMLSPRLRPVLMRPGPGGQNWSVAVPNDFSSPHLLNTDGSSSAASGLAVGASEDSVDRSISSISLSSSPRVSAHRSSISGASSGYAASISATSSPPHSSSSSSFSVATSPPSRRPMPIPNSHSKFRDALNDDMSGISSLSSTRSINTQDHYNEHYNENDNDSDQEGDGDESEGSSVSDLRSSSTGEGLSSSHTAHSGSPVSKPISIISPRSMAADSHSSLQLRTSTGGSVPTAGTSPSVATKSVGRIPRTKSVALNPMQVGRTNSNTSTLASPREAPLSPVGVSSPHFGNAGASSTTLSAAPQTTNQTSTTASTSDSYSSGALRSSSSGLVDRRTSHAGLGLQALQAIPTPIASALNMPTTVLEMRTGGDVHLAQWSWDSSKKHGFLKMSTDHSSISWGSATNYGLARSNTPLTHKKTFIEIAKTRGVSQLLHVGLARSISDWSCSPQKMQFNSVSIPGEWSAIWIKNSATGDRLGVLFELDNFKMTVFKNGIVAYTNDIPQTFQLAEEKKGEESSSSQDTAEVIAEETSQNDLPLIYPFVGICGDQDILITEMPEFEKYVDITWAHERMPQLIATTPNLDGVPAVLEMLGLQKLKPKFDGMSLTSFQKLKDVDLRKMGATTEQRKRLMSQIETMK